MRAKAARILRQWAIDRMSKKQSNDIIDENEKFALYKCVSYLMNIASIKPIYHHASIEVLLWVLGGETKYLLKYLNDYVVSSKKSEELGKFKLPLFDHDEGIDHINSIIQSMGQKHSRNLQLFIYGLLEKRKKTLAHKRLSSIEKKLSAFQKMFKLTDVEIEFSALLLISTLWRGAEEYFIEHLHCNSFTNRKYLANMLQVSYKDLDMVFQGTLEKINFFEKDRHALAMNDDFIDFFQKSSEQVLSKNFFEKMTARAIPLSMHMIDAEQTRHTLELLKKKPQRSTHILIYGPPGTGKTSYAAGVIRELGLVGYEIVKDDGNESKMRRAAIISCCNMKQNEEDAVVVIDEADNILNTQDAWFHRGETQDKGWLNKFLEEKRIRMIWITNSIDAIEDSVIRRFAYSIQFKAFNRKQRAQLWESILKKNGIGKYFSQEEILQLAKNYKVSAGVIDLAVQKTMETYSINGNAHYKKAIIRSLDAHQALAHNGYKPIPKNNVEEIYSLDGLNIRGDLKAMMLQLEKVDVLLRQRDRKQNMNMNLLFYGPPGTGKSELARYIAHHLDRELICKRASDVFDPYVGMTERNMKDMFAEAENEEAVLIVDEADSMLSSRDRAVRSWELSFTNEFLTQMERFNGILICTTNRLKDLDSASVRRFNHKIEFNYLNPAGNITFYNLFLAPLSKGNIDGKAKNTLSAMTNLAPGDFKVVRDRYALVNEERITHNELIEALEGERHAKEIFSPSRKKIGF
jgi:transitional endoplasmic reticulum ATPase